jgi:hypothetical protein
MPPQPVEHLETSVQCLKAAVNAGDDDDTEDYSDEESDYITAEDDAALDHAYNVSCTRTQTNETLYKAVEKAQTDHIHDLHRLSVGTQFSRPSIYTYLYLGVLPEADSRMFRESRRCPRENRGGSQGNHRTTREYGEGQPRVRPYRARAAQEDNSRAETGMPDPA